MKKRPRRTPADVMDTARALIREHSEAYVIVRITGIQEDGSANVEVSHSGEDRVCQWAIEIIADHFDISELDPVEVVAITDSEAKDKDDEDDDRGDGLPAC